MTFFKTISVAVAMMAAPANLMANATADAETCLRADSSDILKEETAELVGEIENDEANKKATQNKMKIAHLYYGVMTGYYGLTIKKDHGGPATSPEYKSAFSTKVDNVLVFAPLAATYTLKLAGVESRNSWQKMAVSNALSIGIAMGTSKIIENNVTRRRPMGGSDTNCFPSTHTVMAYTGATILSNEYAWKHPWIGVGGYACATLTALMRRTNDMHWYSDLSMGASIGITSTELGYWITDLLFKSPKGGKARLQKAVIDKSFRPSFANSFMGMSYINSEFNIGNDHISFKKGNKGGLESAYFFNPYVGAGGQIYVTTNQVKVNGEAQDHAFDCAVIGCGPYFSFPVTNTLLIGANATASYTAYPNCDLNPIDYRLGGRDGFGYGAGASLSWLLGGLKQNIRLYCAYASLPSIAEGSGRLKTFGYGIGFSKMFSVK